MPSTKTRRRNAPSSLRPAGSKQDEQTPLAAVAVSASPLITLPAILFYFRLTTYRRRRNSADCSWGSGNARRRGRLPAPTRGATTTARAFMRLDSKTR